VLSLWLQTALFAPLAAVIATYVLASGALERAGNAAAELWAHIPGSNLVSEPLNAIRAAQLQDTPVGQFLGEAGLWVIVTVLFLATIFSVIAPPERPIPWADSTGWRTAVRWFFRITPYLALLVILVALGAAANLFITGSTTGALAVGRVTGITLAVVLGLLAVWAVVGQRLREGLDGRPASNSTSRSGDPGAPPNAQVSVAQEDPQKHRVLRFTDDLLDYASTVVVLALAAVLVISPFVAMAVFEAVGRDVLGIVVVIIAFQVLGRIGEWRWTVWDQRERSAARTGQAYPSVGRVVVQIGLLTATMAALFVGVIFNLDPALLVAAALAVVSVLLGVAVDVVDAQRLERRASTKAFLQQSLTRKS
jgi:hypothetical protein